VLALTVPFWAISDRSRRVLTVSAAIAFAVMAALTALALVAGEAAH
jgi:hypothetical protein